MHYRMGSHATNATDAALTEATSVFPSVVGGWTPAGEPNLYGGNDGTCSRTSVSARDLCWTLLTPRGDQIPRQFCDQGVQGTIARSILAAFDEARVCPAFAPKTGRAHAGMAKSESIRSLVARWKTGDQLAADRIYSLYSQRLWTLAKRRIDTRLAQRVGASDVVQSAFRSFFRLARDGEIRIHHSESVWRLLAAITVNKVRQQRERHNAGRRRRDAEVRLTDLKTDPSAFAHVPTPEEAVVLADEIEGLLARLDPPEPEILGLCLQGFSPSEIAREVHCSRWSVRRVLNRIGHQLERRLEENT